MNVIKVRHIFRPLVQSINVLVTVNGERVRKTFDISCPNSTRLWTAGCIDRNSESNDKRNWVNLNRNLSVDLVRQFSTSANHKNQSEFKLKPKKNEGFKANKDEIHGKTEDFGNQSKTESSTGENEKRNEKEHLETEGVEEKLSMTAKFKKMYKEYWYVLLPVHIATSSIWLGGFYYLSTR